MLRSLALLLALTISLAHAGEIHPVLQERLLASAPDEIIPVVIRLRDRIDIQALSSALTAQKATRQYRHYVVVTTLREKAAATQGPLLNFLTEQRQMQSVRNFESYWIENQIAASVSPSLVAHLAAHRDVEIIFLEPEIHYDEPLDMGFTPAAVSSSEIGLRAVRADYLWRTGIAGQGRLLMNIDTGVRGDHVALASRWRGTLPGVLPTHAWYNGSGGTFPADSDNPGHGTHTMGTMVGLDSVNRDTVGVAPGAYWIAGTGSYSGAFQWAVDPDGNPLTVDDVPDAINCSWFTSGDLCAGGTGYWALMDNVEAAGAAVIWSAGNCGPTGGAGSCTGGATPGPYKTITPPKNRVTTDINAFSVGALNGANLVIAGFSSRGPSACDTTIIKPEVSAPGASVRSTYANGGFGTLSGTSMAAPHVAGAVALLRQVDPDAEVDDIKHALLNTAVDLGPAGEDNAYGKGIINILSAAESITPRSLFGKVTFNSAPLAGATVTIPAAPQVRTTDSTGFYAHRPLRDSISILVQKFGYYDTTIAVVVSPNAAETVDVAMTLLPVASMSGLVKDSLTQYGISGAGLDFYKSDDPSGNPTYSTTTNSSGAYAFTAMVGAYRVVLRPPAPYVGKTEVPSFNLGIPGGTLDFAVLEAQVVLVDDDAGASYDTMYVRSIESSLQLRLRIIPSMLFDSTISAFAVPPVVVWFTGNDTVNALDNAERLSIVGMLNNQGRLILTGQNIAQFSPPGDTLLSRMLGIQYVGLTTSFNVRGFAGDVIGDGLTYSLLGGANNQISKDNLSIQPGSSGSPVGTMYYLIGTDSTNLAGIRVTGPANQWAVSYFGFGLEGILPARRDTLIARSIRFFDQIFVNVREPLPTGVPQEFILEQNYPNPFNPSTVIRYGLPSTGRISIAIFDILGKEVIRLVDDVQSAGFHEVTWNGTRADGTQVSSGIYLYRLTAGEFASTKKLVLMK